MPDREKVIKGLECCIIYVNCGANGGCPYKTGVDEKCLETVMKDALAMLKAQEPVKPVVDIDTWKCGNCGHALEHQQLLGDNVLLHEQYDYCPMCGKAVKWE